jgi:hypothetical protein
MQAPSEPWSARISRLRRRPPAERAALLRAAALLPLAAASLRVAGYRRTAAWLDRPVVEQGRAQPLSPAALGELVDLAARRGPFAGATCLPRSLVLQHLLRLHGYGSVVRFGVRAEGTRVFGHAWVEHDGLVIGDAPDVARQYAPFEGPAPGLAGRP